MAYRRRFADGQPILDRASSKHIGGQNLARFKNAEFDAIYDKMRVLPDGPERLQLFDEAKRLLIAYAPYKWGVHRIHTDLAQPWLHGYRRGAYWGDWWQYVDIDAEAAGEGNPSEPAAFPADERGQSRRRRAAAAVDPRARSQQNIFRYAFPSAETGFDPAQISDLYSRTVTSHIFDSLYYYDYLARPARIRPLAAAALPEVSSDFRVFTFPIRRGIFFQDDPAFKGARRELVAQDFVYSLKRFFDPRWKSPIVRSLEEFKIVGLNELRQRSLKERTPFPTTLKFEGLRALDRYTLQIRLRDTIRTSSRHSRTRSVRRRRARSRGDVRRSDHGPSGRNWAVQAGRLAALFTHRSGAKSDFREEIFDGDASASDAKLGAVANALKGKRLPLVDRVEVYIIDEPQPRWLAFLNAEHDMLERLPATFVNIAAPGGQLAPNLRRRGVTMSRVLGADITYTVFNMKDPVVGGYTPERVALRRAFSLATNMQEEIRLPRRGQGVQARRRLIRTPTATTRHW